MAGGKYNNGFLLSRGLTSFSDSILKKIVSRPADPDILMRIRVRILTLFQILLYFPSVFTSSLLYFTIETTDSVFSSLFREQSVVYIYRYYIAIGRARIHEHWCESWSATLPKLGRGLKLSSVLSCGSRPFWYGSGSCFSLWYRSGSCLSFWSRSGSDCWTRIRILTVSKG